MNYGIQYTTQDKAIYTVSQSQFLTQNLKTITDKKINVNKYIKQPSPFAVAAKERDSFTLNQNKNLALTSDLQNTNPSHKKNNNDNLVLLILLFLFTAIVFLVGLVLLLKKRALKGK